MDNEKENNSNPFLTQVHHEGPPATVPQPGWEVTNKKKKKVSVWLLLFWIFLLLLFLTALLIFVLVIWGTESPLLGLLWIEALTIQTSLLRLTNTVFSGFSIVLFLLLSIWVFRWLFAKKEELDKKKFSLLLSLFSWVSLFITMVVWFWLYNFIAEFNFQLNIKTELIIKPANTHELTAPVVINFSIDKAIMIAESKWKIISKIYWDFDNDGSYDKDWLDSQIDYEVKSSWVNKVAVLIEFSDWNSQKFEKIFSLWNATFFARPDTWFSPLSVEFDANNLVEDWSAIIEFRWFFDWINSDPKITSSPDTSYVFEKIGNYDITLVTLDSSNVVKKYNKKIKVKAWVAEKPATAVIVSFPSNNWPAPFKLTLDWSDSASTKWDIISYTWNFKNSWESIAWKLVNKTFELPWEYEIELVVKDKLWNIWTSKKTIKVTENDAAPVAIIKTTPEILTWSIPFSIAFDASESIDKNNDIVEYLWDFNWDWEYEANWEKTSNIFRNVWKQSVILKIKDSKWNEATATLTFTLSDITVKAIINVDKNSWAAPLVVSFDASSSQVSLDDNIVNFEWDFWDWTPKKFAWAKNKHKYFETWNYTVNLKIFTEKWKNYNANKTIFVREQGLQACFTASKTKTTAPSKIQFESSCSIWDVESWTWDFWDWNISRQRSPLHEFVDIWTYNVVLQIMNINNDVSDYKQVIEVE